MKSREVRLARRPHGEPVPEDFELAEVELPEPGEGRLLVRNVFMSVDPYMRGRMSDAPSYVPPYELGKVMYGGAVGEVVAGDEAGTLVVHQLGWREHAIVDANRVRRAVRARRRAGQRAARRARDAGADRLGRRDRHRAGGGGRDRVRLRGGGRGRERRGPDREGARLPRDRQRRLAREGRLRARRARLRRRLLPPRRRPAPRCARRRPTASTSTSTTSAARSSRRSSAASTPTAGSRSAARSRSTTRPSPRPARATSGCSSASAPACAASSSSTTPTASRTSAPRSSALIADGRLKLAETVVDGGIEAAPGAFTAMLRGEHLGKVVVQF